MLPFGDNKVSGFGFVGKQPVLGKVKDQESAHPVIGETLPHLCEEQDEQPLGVTQKGPRAVAMRQSGRCDCVSIGHEFLSPGVPVLVRHAKLVKRTLAANPLK